jgi:hypothetical protein
MLGKIGDKDLREKIIRVYGSSKSLFDYLIYYSRQSDTGRDGKLQELEQKRSGFTADCCDFDMT